ncbi:MAG: hypothetical protein RI897_696 [Verrucomicrobiota bacterium]|jgi:hypothetical protein
MVRGDGAQVLMGLSLREKEWLEFLLEAYPLTPEGHLPLSHSVGEEGLREEREMLAASLKESRQGNLGLVDRFLAEMGKASEVEDGIRISVEESQIDWLLEVLNDVRVGCWVRLGRPDPDEMQEGQGEEALHAAMGIAGYFQAGLLAALEDLEKS